jgi:2'-hydroxyisoflavone reductase
MKLLVLGGTLFLGRHVADAARKRGHDVTLFHRGTRPPHRTDVKDLHGQRDPDVGGGLHALASGRWDAVVDTSGYVPRHVRASAALLRDRGARAYVLVSSVNAYPAPVAGLDEQHPVHEPLEGDEVTGETYGALKVGCERAVTAAFGDAGLSVRAGLIVGPEDQTNRFAYWCTRIAAGGDVLVPAVPDQPVQVVDVRDMATFLVSAAERSFGGVVNVAGARGQLTFAGLMERIRAVSGSDARLVPVPPERLEAEGIRPWEELPLWLPPQFGVFDIDDRKALAMGMTHRPIEDTIRDTLAWARTAPPAAGLHAWLKVPPAGITRDREAMILRSL